MKNRFVKFSGILGAVLLGFGIVGGLLIGTYSAPLIVLHVGAGTLLILFWFVVVGVRSLNEAQGVIKGRATRYGGLAVLYTTLFAALLILANWYVARHDKQWDLSEQGVFSLTSQSKNVVTGLQKPLQLVGFKTPEQSDQIRDLLERYRTAAPDKVNVTLIDPRVKPHLVDKYGMKRGNVIYVEYGENNAAGASRINDVTEEAVTNAILKLTRGDAKKIYYIEGHGEPDLKSTEPLAMKSLAGALEDEHFQVEPLFLSTKGEIPGDAVAVILASPKKPLIPQERDLLVAYANNGGRLLLFHDPQHTNDVAWIAEQFGITIGNNVIIDQIQRLFSAPALGAQPVAQSYGQHPITREFNEQTATIFNIASSVATPQDARVDGVTYTDLVKTSPTSWAETDLNGLFSTEPTAEKDGADVQGPITVAAAYEKKLDSETKPPENSDSTEPVFEKTARVVVFGDSDFILNTNFEVFANRDLVLNSINWLLGEEGGISIRPRAIRASVAPIQRETYIEILAASFLLPELLLVFGLAVWWRRREVSVA